MAILENTLLIIAILWITVVLTSVRHNARKGETVVLPVLSSVLVFSLMTIITVTMGLSRFHLLWMFPLSLVMGTLSLIIPFVSSIVMGSVVVLAWPLNSPKRKKR